MVESVFCLRQMEVVYALQLRMDLVKLHLTLVITIVLLNTTRFACASLCGVSVCMWVPVGYLKVYDTPNPYRTPYSAKRFTTRQITELEGKDILRCRNFLGRTPYVQASTLNWHVVASYSVDVRSRVLVHGSSLRLRQLLRW